MKFSQLLDIGQTPVGFDGEANRLSRHTFALCIGEPATKKRF